MKFIETSKDLSREGEAREHLAQKVMQFLSMDLQEMWMHSASETFVSVGLDWLLRYYA